MFGDSGEGDGGITRQFAAAAGDGDRIDALLELNSDHEGGVQGAETRLRAMLQRSEFLHVAKDLRIIGDLYVPCQLNLREAVQLVALDRATEMEGQKVAPEELSRERAIRRIWPDQEVRALSHLSGLATRIGAARRAYTAFMRPNAVPAPSTAIAGADDQSFGKGIVWAIVDSGVDERHMHFWRHGNLVGAVASLHKDFSGSAGGALGDEYGHGTHVAGIVAGAGPPPPFPNRFVGERIRQGTVDLNANQLGDEPLIVTRRMAPTELPFGVAPATQLVSIKVLDDLGNSSVSRVIEALEYVRKVVNRTSDGQHIDGVNISLGYSFDPRWNGCGWTPLCHEVDQLVRSGVVVVVAAGNSGYGDLQAHFDPGWKAGMVLTINDPANAEGCIAVGSVDGRAPEKHGVSWFSSKGPTGDGRCKPDLVAPGERIVSCAAGKAIRQMNIAPDDSSAVAYVEETGTSMAAPYVSGSIAAFLSAHPEYLGRPLEVKRRFLETAISLGRDQYFEGHGMVDLARALQSV